MLLKPAPETPPIFGRRNGSVFTFGRIGQVMKNLPATALHRTASQHSKMQFIMSACRHWRNIGGESLTAWQNWVTFQPQRILRSSDVFLNAYQNFIKRNYYFQLFRSDFSQWLLNPALVTYEADPPSITITLSSEVLLLNATFARNDSTIEYFISVSQAISAGVDFSQNNNRLQIMTLNNSGSFDITEAFISTFGKLPAISAILFCSFVGCGADNGQFFFEEQIKTEVQEVEPIVVPAGFGYLYSADCILNPSDIIRSGWRLPSADEWISLILEFGGYSEATSHFCDTDLQYWFSGFLAGDNSSLLTARGTGFISEDSFLTNFQHSSRIWGSPFENEPSLASISINQPSGFSVIGSGYFNQFSAFAIRVVKPDEGEQFYEGFNGIKYPVFRFGGLVWSYSNLQETLFSDLSEIPTHSGRSTWLSSSGARLALISSNFNNQ